MTKKWFLIFCLLQQGQVFFHSVQAYGNPQYTSNLQAVVFNDSLGISRFNASISFDKEIFGIKAMIAMKVKKPSGGSYYREILKTTMDVCRLQEGVTGNFVAKLIFETLKDHSNYNFECPVKKDAAYYIRNFQVSTGILPLRLFSEIVQGETFFNVTTSVKGRISEVKGLAQIFSVNFYGSVVFK
jgi:Protein of unknown function (DUF1091)